MPELPEVESIVIGLNKHICGLKIKKTIVKYNGIVAFPEVEEFKKILQGKQILEVNRRGKYILINLTGNKTMVFHLRMTGKLLVVSSDELYKKHTHLIFNLDNKHDLRFNNIRKFGRVYLINKGEWKKAGGLAGLGPEPLADDFSCQDFINLFSNRSGRIKSLLLNQKFLAGMGNIYTDEALFRAGIHPCRKADTLSENELEKLYHAIRKVLALGIKYRGTSFSDYVNALGEKGKFQEKLLVYQKAGKKCPRCNTEIVREKIGGRSSHFCPECQK